MVLKKKKYRIYHVFSILFQVAPIWTLLRILLLIVFAIVPSGVIAVVTGLFVDRAVEVLNGLRKSEDIYLPFILMIFTLAITTNIGSFIKLVSSKMKFNLQQKFKPALVRVNASLKYRYIEDSDSWELISRIMRSPTESILAGFEGFARLAEITIGISAILVIILVHVWWAVFVIIGFSVPMLYLSMKAGKKKYQASRDAERYKRRYEYLGGVLSERDSIEERTLFDYGDEIADRWREQFELARVLELKINIRTSLITQGSSIILALEAILIALTLIKPVISGDISAGLYIGIEAAVFNLVRMLGWQLFQATESISGVNEYMKDLTSFIKLERSDDSLELPKKDTVVFESLEFCNVSFKYPNAKEYVLKDVSFSINSGLHYALVGKNGEGKTTITKLITGLYDDYEGQIFLNGIELREYSHSELKAMFSVVYQDFARYYVSLKENIALGEVGGSIDSEKMAEIVSLVGLDETVSDLSEGVDTPLGKILDGGQELSGGQWQRIAIARSLASSSPVKILDEPTASLDPVGESNIYKEFEKLMKNKTAIFISHRLGSTKLADRIIVIANGKVSESGTHDELMKSGGEYSIMFNAQRAWYR